VSDDLFQYFNKNSTRKFEPIDDPEFNSLDEEDQPPTSAQSVDAGPTSSAPSDELSLREDTAGIGLTADAGTAKPASPLAPTLQESGAKVVVQSSSEPVSGQEPKTETKKGESHWDFLAGLLGIKKSPPSAPQPTTTGTFSPESKTPSTPPTPSTPTATPQLGDLGLTPIPTQEESGPLKEMFRPGEAKRELDLFEDSRKESPFDQESVFPDDDDVDEFDGELEEDDLFEPIGQGDEESDSWDDDVEYLEFEIEEWDSLRSEDDQPARRRPPRHSTDQEVRDPRPAATRQPESRSPDSRKPDSRKPDSRRPDSRQPDSRQPDSRQPDSRKSDSRQPSSRADRDQPSRDPHHRTPRPTEKSSMAPPSKSTPPAKPAQAAELVESRSDFGAGLFDDASPGDSLASQAEPKSRRRRRRRGGRSQNDPVDQEPYKESYRESDRELEETKNFVPEIENDPPDEFFDEIGWNPNPAKNEIRSGRGQRGRPDEVDDADVADAYLDGSDLLEPEDADGDLRKRKRKRRRGKKNREKEIEGVVPISDLDEDEDFLDETVDFDDSPAQPSSEVPSYSRPQRKKKGDDARHSTPKNKDKRSESDDDDDLDGDLNEGGKKTKFPTWDEAIAGLVQSNIKNHARYDRGGRSSGGGKRHR